MRVPTDGVPWTPTKSWHGFPPNNPVKNPAVCFAGRGQVAGYDAGEQAGGGPRGRRQVPPRRGLRESEARVRVPFGPCRVREGGGCAEEDGTLLDEPGKLRRVFSQFFYGGSLTQKEFTRRSGMFPRASGTQTRIRWFDSLGAGTAPGCCSRTGTAPPACGSCRGRMPSSKRR